MSTRSGSLWAVVAGGILVLLLVSAPSILRRTQEGRALEAARVAGVIEEALAHGPGLLTLVEEGRQLSVHLLREPGTLLRASGLEEPVPLRFRIPGGLRLARMEGPAAGGLPLCRGFRCAGAGEEWARWVLVPRGAGSPEVWVTVARSGEFDVRLRQGDGTFAGPLVVPGMTPSGH